MQAATGGITVLLQVIGIEFGETLKIGLLDGIHVTS
jgi:hypothetical protein